MEALLSHLLNSITLGAIYALIAVGYTMVYGIIKLINFAHGEIIMFGAFFGLLLVQQGGMHLSVAMLVAMLICGGVGLLLDWTAYLPLRRNKKLGNRVSIAGVILIAVLAVAIFQYKGEPEYARLVSGMGFGLVGVALAMGLLAVLESAGRMGPPENVFQTERLSALITAIGMSLSFQTLAQLIWGATPRSFTEHDIPKFLNSALLTIGGANILGKELVVWGAAILLMVVLNLIVQHTKIGMAMRACALDQRTASLMGINVNGVIAVTFVIGSSMAAVAGVLYAIKVGGNISFRMGYYPGVIAFAAAVLGGIGNIRGAMYGGVILGFTQGLGEGYLSSGYGPAYGFLVMVLVITFKPHGLFGRAGASRA